MPRSAIQTGAADFILPPDRMPEQLLAFVKHPFESRAAQATKIIEDGDSMSKLFAELRKRTKVDFSLYKKNTIIRRLERRIAINNTADIDEYLAYLYSNPGEVTALYKELLIGVTSFFRDPEAMNEVMNIHLPNLMQRSENKELRFWCAGCSSGEEAYTIAIMAKEAMEKLGISRDIKVFATDIDKNAIQNAGSGIYPESIAADLNSKILGKYFYKRDDHYQIVRNIREMVVFAHHNLIKDPPFTKIDFISCRNLLIYLQPVLQQKAMEMFNFSLNENGLLLLGTSETVGDMADYFEPLNHKNKLFRSKGLTTKTLLSNSVPRQKLGRQQGGYTSDRRRLGEDNSFLPRFLEVITDKYVRLAVVVNSSLEILHTFGDTSGFFRIPQGKPNYEIPSVAVKELSIPLSTGIQKVFRKGVETVYSNLRLPTLPEDEVIRLRIMLLPEKKGQEKLVAVFFERIEKDVSENSDSETVDYNVQDDAMQRIRDLETDLQYTKENLQATIEELETSNEELQATNEELLSSNEELQSTNEELQSTNEELYTVNTEYQNKINELTELNNDVENLLSSSRIGELILDENLEIRRFSPEMTKIFNIIEQDLGRPVEHISHNIIDFDLIKEIRKVNSGGKEFEKKVYLKNDYVYLMRIIPYHIGPQVFSGVVLTFVDMTYIEKTEKKLEHQEKEYEYLFNEMAQGVVYQNADGVITRVNPAAEKILGLTFEQMQGRTSMDERWKAVRADGSPLPGDEHPAMVALKKGESIENYVMGVFNPLNEQINWILVNSKPVFENGKEKPESVFSTFEDITDQKVSEARLKESYQKLEYLFSITGLAWWDYDLSTGKVRASSRKAEMIGLEDVDEEVELEFWTSRLHPDDYERVMNAMRDHLEGRAEEYNTSYRIKNSKGKYTDFEDSGRIVEWNENGKPIRLIGTVKLKAGK